MNFDPEAYAAEQERKHYTHLNALDDEREVQAYFDEHGVEPGGICPNCGHTDAGCTCDKWLFAK